MTFSCYQRPPLLTNDLWRRMLCEAIDRAIERHAFRLFAFVIMPDHVHPLVHPRTTDSRIADLLRAIKRPYSYRIKKLLESESATPLALLDKPAVAPVAPVPRASRGLTPPDRQP